LSDTPPGPEVPHCVHGAVEVHLGLDVHGERVGARVHEGLEVGAAGPPSGARRALGRVGRMPPPRRPDGQVGHEVASITSTWIQSARPRPRPHSSPSRRSRPRDGRCDQGHGVVPPARPRRPRAASGASARSNQPHVMSRIARMQRQPRADRPGSVSPNSGSFHMYQYGLWPARAPRARSWRQTRRTRYSVCRSTAAASSGAVREGPSRFDACSPRARGSRGFRSPWCSLLCRHLATSSSLSTESYSKRMLRHVSKAAASSGLDLRRG